MNEQPNPYAPPRDDNDYDSRLVGQGGVLRREGDLVVIPVQGAIFPPRCVVCNEPAQHRLRRKLYWHPPAYYALICMGVLIYAIVALIVRKTAQFEVGLCQQHHARRRNWILLGWLGVPASFIAGVMLADTQAGPVLMLIGVVVALSLLVAAVLMVNVVTARRIDGGQAWIKVGRPFLDSL